MEWNENNIRISKLTIEDAEWLSLTAKKAYFDHYRHLWYDEGEWYAERCFNVAQLQLELSDENALFFGVAEGRESLGFLKVNIDYPLSKMHCQADYLELLTFETDEIINALELERIYLTKKGQNRGIGQRLVQLTVDLARSRGKDIVWLKAMDTSAATLGFYDKLGFQTCATMRLNFDIMKPEIRGMVAMRKGIFLK
jgi:diamine N-acetyltransferase